MSTLKRIREIATIAVLATGALIASVSVANAGCASDETSAVAFADLGQLTVTAERAEHVADLGGLTVTASRLSDKQFADLGSLTVTASRFADVRVADLGDLTVTATRIKGSTVATRPSATTWN
jgi:hypothetical protein